MTTAEELTKQRGDRGLMAPRPLALLARRCEHSLINLELATAAGSLGFSRLRSVLVLP
jgi:hypothetical protein